MSICDGKEQANPKHTSYRKHTSQGETAPRNKVMQMAGLIGNSAMEAYLRQGVFPASNDFASESGGQKLPPLLCERIEAGSGFSFEDVRVHYNSDKPKRLGALAYTRGSEVHIGPGQEEHLEHELGHVVQQKQGIAKPTKNINGININDEKKLEKGLGYDASLKPEMYSGSVQLTRNAGSKQPGVIQRMEADNFYDPLTPAPVPAVNIITKNDLMDAGAAVPGFSALSTTDNKITHSPDLPAEEVLNLAFKSGTILRQGDDGRYRVIYVAYNNEIGKNTEPDVINSIMSKVVTGAVGTCSFIVMSDAARSFALICHLDSTTQYDVLLDKLDSEGMNPSHLFASIIDEPENPDSLEKQRIKAAVERFHITNIKILNRGENADFTENAHQMIGFDTATFEVFGEMGEIELADPNGRLDSILLYSVLPSLKRKYTDELLLRVLGPLGLKEAKLAVEAVLCLIGSNKIKPSAGKDSMIERGAEECLKNADERNRLLRAIVAEIPKIRFRVTAF